MRLLEAILGCELHLRDAASRVARADIAHLLPGDLRVAIGRARKDAFASGDTSDLQAWEKAGRPVTLT